MAPESVTAGTYSHKSDVFSFGIVIWECYSLGKEPFADLTALETAMAVGSGTRLAQPPGCPEIVYELLQAMWLLEPSHRPAFGSIAVVLQALATGVMIPLTKQPPVTPRDSVITSGRQSEGYLPLGGDEEALPGIKAYSANTSYEVRAGSPDESTSGYLRQSFRAKRKATMQYKPTAQI